MKHLPESIQLAVEALDEAYKEYNEAVKNPDKSLRTKTNGNICHYTFQLIAALTEEVL